MIAVWDSVIYEAFIAEEARPQIWDEIIAPIFVLDEVHTVGLRLPILKL
jgi:hypothetical protein